MRKFKKAILGPGALVSVIMALVLLVGGLIWMGGGFKIGAQLDDCDNIGGVCKPACGAGEKKRIADCKEKEDICCADPEKILNKDDQEPGEGDGGDGDGGDGGEDDPSKPGKVTIYVATDKDFKNQITQGDNQLSTIRPGEEVTLYFTVSDSSAVSECDFALYGIDARTNERKELPMKSSSTNCEKVTHKFTIEQSDASNYNSFEIQFTAFKKDLTQSTKWIDGVLATFTKRMKLDSLSCGDYNKMVSIDKTAARTGCMATDTCVWCGEGSGSCLDGTTDYGITGNRKEIVCNRECGPEGDYKLAAIENRCIEHDYVGTCADPNNQIPTISVSRSDSLQTITVRCNDQNNVVNDYYCGCQYLAAGISLNGDCDLFNRYKYVAEYDQLKLNNYQMYINYMSIATPYFILGELTDINVVPLTATMCVKAGHNVYNKEKPQENIYAQQIPLRSIVQSYGRQIDQIIQ